MWMGTFIWIRETIGLFPSCWCFISCKSEQFVKQLSVIEYCISVF